MSTQEVEDLGKNPLVGKSLREKVSEVEHSRKAISEEPHTARRLVEEAYVSVAADALKKHQEDLLRLLDSLRSDIQPTGTTVRFPPVVEKERLFQGLKEHLPEFFWMVYYSWKKAEEPWHTDVEDKPYSISEVVKLRGEVRELIDDFKLRHMLPGHCRYCPV